MYLKYDKELGGWEITKITKEERKVIAEMGLTLLLASVSALMSKEIENELKQEQKQAKKSTKH